MNLLTLAQGECLLRLARQSIAEALGVSPLGPSDSDQIPDLACGTFVTLSLDGQLRGCIGNILADGLVCEGVRRNAVRAALGDSRFVPLTAPELERLVIDISLLSTPQRVQYQDGADLIRQLCPGEDGVILRLGAAEATFLPQVWGQLPEAELFLASLCHKAGVADTAWCDSYPEIEVYRAQCFEEEKR